MTINVLLPGSGIFNNNAALTAAQCAQLSTYLSDPSASTCSKTSGLRFSCTTSPRTVTIDGKVYSEMVVCADGGQETNTWQQSIDQMCADQIVDVLGYPTCDVYVYANTTCGQKSQFGTNCQNGNMDFPHNCYPGNSAANGGIKGLTGAYTSGTPYQVSPVVADGNKFAFSIEHDRNGCTPYVPKGGGPPSSCCDMTIEKMEIVINNNCYGQVQMLTINGVQVASSYANNTFPAYPSVFPTGYPAWPWYTIFKPTQLNIPTGTINVEVTLRAGSCSTARDFLPNGMLWFSYFNGNTYRNNCCGTGASLFQ